VNARQVLDLLADNLSSTISHSYTINCWYPVQRRASFDAEWHSAGNAFINYWASV